MELQDAGLSLLDKTAYVPMVYLGLNYEISILGIFMLYNYLVIYRSFSSNLCFSIRLRYN